MTLAGELGFGGVVAHLAAALALWGVSVLVGGLLLPRTARRLSRLEFLALAGPWGIVFLTAVVAAVASGGTSMLTPLPILQLAIRAVSLVRGRQVPDSPAVDQPDGNSDRRGVLHGYGMSVLLFATLLLGTQLVARTVYVPERGPGERWMPHYDRCFWAAWSRQLAQDGVESYSSLSVLNRSEQGKPILHSYHYVELWLTGYTARWLGFNPLTTLLLVVHPLFGTMIALACAALASVFLPRQGWAWLAGVTAVFVTGLVNHSGVRYGFNLPEAWWSFSLFSNINYCVGTALVLSAMLHGVRGRSVMAGIALGCATLVGQPLLALLGPALLLVGLWGFVSYLRKGEGLDAVRLALVGLATAGGLFLWTKVTGHTVPPVFSEGHTSLVRQVWRTLAIGLLSAGGLTLGLPFLVGLWRLWTADRPAQDRQAVQTVVMLCLAVCLVSFFVYSALGGGSIVNAGQHILFLMWSAFLIPVGWTGLCLMLAEGPRRGAAAGLTGLVLVFGLASTLEDFRYEWSRGGPAFSPEQVEELRSACQGQKVGYFAAEDQDEESWWRPQRLGWAVLADCKLIRLNQVAKDRSSEEQHAVWQQAAPAAYARAQGVAWRNEPDMVLGFAQAHGIRVIVELPNHPVPEKYLPHLEPIPSAGSFKLYRLSDAPAVGATKP